MTWHATWRVFLALAGLALVVIVPVGMVLAVVGLGIWEAVR